MSATVHIGRLLRTDIGRGTVISVVLHVILFLFFLVISVGVEYYPPDFAEVTFLSGARGGAQPGEAVSVGQLPPQGPLKQLEAPTRPAATEELVNVPKRRMLEPEPPAISSRSGEKLPVERPAPAVAPPSSQAGALEEPAPQLPAATEGKAAAPVAQSGEAKEGPSTISGAAGSAQESFRIEGEAANRQILYKVVPEYPPGLQREAVVRVRFVVLPDGSVGEMVPVLKGDPTLESITLQALRQWRFNPLPPGAPQKEVTGIITFRYLLR